MSTAEATGTAPAVLVQRDGHVLVVTINRPEARNAVNLDVHLGIGLALEDAEHDPDIRAIILTGAGDKAFCAGADLKAVARGERLIPEDPAQAAWGFAGFVRHHVSKPVIAAVNGTALGGGTELVLAADLAVAADTALFGLPEVGRGIVAAAGGAFRLPRQIPPKIALEHMLTGEPLTASQAAELGLVNRVVPQRQVFSAACELAALVCRNAPLAVQATKRIAQGLTDGVRDAEAAHWIRSDSEARAVMRTADAQEGPRAFAEQREPVWKAR